MQNHAIDMLRPDPLFAVGYSGCRRIADMAEQLAVPLTMRSVGAVLQNAMTAQSGASTRNVVMTETNFGNRPAHEEYIKEKGEIRDGMLKVPDGPGLGVTVNEQAPKEARMPGEPWWD
jgi:L-alanine-DL-glutamate epimerase-like enolase superfamily enzyme